MLDFEYDSSERRSVTEGGRGRGELNQEPEGVKDKFHNVFEPPRAKKYLKLQPSEPPRAQKYLNLEPRGLTTRVLSCF